MTTQYEFEIGTTLEGMTNLEELTTKVVPPKSTYQSHAGTRKLADGTYRGIGAPVTTWHWDVLPQDQRDQLREFCPDVSATVYIQTYTRDTADSTAVFQAVMHWPVNDEDVYCRRRLDFTIEFTELVLQV